MIIMLALFYAYVMISVNCLDHVLHAVAVIQCVAYLCIFLEK